MSIHSDEVKMLILRVKESQNRLNRLLYVIEEKMMVDKERRTGTIGPRTVGESEIRKANVQSLNVPKHKSFCHAAGRCDCWVDRKIAAVFEAIEGFMIHAANNGADEPTLFFFEKIRKILA